MYDPNERLARIEGLLANVSAVMNDWTDDGAVNTLGEVAVFLRVARADVKEEVSRANQATRKASQLAADAEAAITAWANGRTPVRTQAAVARNPQDTSAQAAAATDTGHDHVEVFKAWARHPQGTGRSVIRHELYGNTHISTSDARTTAQLDAGLLRKTPRRTEVQRYGGADGRKASTEQVLELTEKGWELYRLAVTNGVAR